MRYALWVIAAILLPVAAVMSQPLRRITVSNGRTVTVGCRADPQHIVNAHRAEPHDVAGAAVRDAALPTAIDNSPAMPPVKYSGGQGSCAAWAVAYYHKSHQESREHGWDISKPSHQFSPSFTYNQARDADGRSTIGHNMQVIVDRGCATLADFPYDADDDDRWPHETDTWVNALSYRASGYDTLPTWYHSNLDALKAVLAGGGTFCVAFTLYENFQDGTALAGDDFYEGLGTKEIGTHAVCVVGYDDTRDAGDDDGVEGGFKFVNSYGDDWAGDGYAWLSYDFFVSNDVTSAYLLNDRVGYQPQAWAEMQIDHGCHADLKVTLYSDGGPAVLPFDRTGHRADDGDDDNDLYAAVDLTDHTQFLPPTDARPWFLQVDDLVAGENGTIRSFSITTDTGGSNYNSEDPPKTIPDQDSAEVTIPHIPLQVVEFPDANLEAAIRQKIDKPHGDIYARELDDIQQLEARRKEISDLTGLEFCTDLTQLDLYENHISDLTPLQGLTGLTDLDLEFNNVSNLSPVQHLTALSQLSLQNNDIADITPLRDLTNLTRLDLQNNDVADISPLQGLTDLVWVFLTDNRIADISPLQNLTNLTWLFLNHNQIQDISPLENLPNLINVYLKDNKLVDIAALVANDGIGDGDNIGLDRNYLDPSEGSEDSANVDTLRNRGVSVTCDNQKPHTVTIVSGPSGNPNPVASGGEVNCSVRTEDSFGHSLLYRWTAQDNAGSFDDTTAQNPTWTAPQNRTHSERSCDITVTAKCRQYESESDTASYTQTVRPVQRELTVNWDPQLGTVLVNDEQRSAGWSGRFYHAEQVELQAVPADAIKFNSWSGDIADTDPTITIEMAANKSVVAQFGAIATIQFNRGWNMVSICQPSDQQATFDDILPESVNAILRWAPRQSCYQEVEFAEVASEYTGEGLWMKSTHDTDAQINVKSPGSQPVEMQLFRGWNLIANPFRGVMGLHAGLVPASAPDTINHGYLWGTDGYRRVQQLPITGAAWILSTEETAAQMYLVSP